MIKLKKVDTYLSDAYLVFEYDRVIPGSDPPETVIVEVSIDRREIIRRLRALKQLVGRQIALLDLKEIIIRMINELREGKEPFVKEYDLTQFIGVDLE